MKAYVAAPNNAIKGILYNAVYNQSQEEIFEDLVALKPSRTFTIADARQLGRTKFILVTFINTTEVPRQLNFYGAVYSCHPFMAKVEACFNCRKPGHRADVCPKERTGLCPRCGIAHPVKPTPDCTPKCILCGGAHFTGTRRCKVRFDRSGNSSNNTAKSTTRTTPPASPPPVSPPESSRNSRSHHRSPSRSRSLSRTSSRQGRHRSRSVSFPPLPGQKDQNIEKQVSGHPQLSSLEKQNAELRAQLTHQSREISELKQQLPAHLRRDHSPVMLPPVVQPRTRPDVPGSSSASPSRATSPTRSPPAKRKSNTEDELAPQPVAEQLALITTSLQTLERALHSLRSDTASWMTNISTCFEAIEKRQCAQEASYSQLQTQVKSFSPEVAFSAPRPPIPP
ncbi:hypothetical protein HPB49_008192 [Dermacentor silvarum]|uniref:Uncharacterized protein n=1 Tax=Dermacentor silvarum TaxID=543639 RepID=A0ACB8DX30_DERSI|nr:hypothetical protein HPB49_008192 [Dermacentor silvarum]